MQYVITVGEALNKGIWDDLCNMFGINPWAMNEGLMESSHEFKLSHKEAKLLHLIED